MNLWFHKHKKFGHTCIYIGVRVYKKYLNRNVGIFVSLSIII